MNRLDAIKRQRNYDKHRDSLIWLISNYKAMKVAEIGVFESKTASRVLRALHTQLETYLMVDQWKEFSSPAITKGSLEDGGYLKVNWDKLHKDAITLATKYSCATVMKMSSCKAAKTQADSSLDLVFIDASHAYDDVLLDLQSWCPKVKSNGVIAGHDYYNRWPGVVKAVNEFFPEADFELQFLPDSVWYVIKK